MKHIKLLKKVINGDGCIEGSLWYSVNNFNKYYMKGDIVYSYEHSHYNKILNNKQINKINGIKEKLRKNLT